MEDDRQDEPAEVETNHAGIEDKVHYGQVAPEEEEEDNEEEEEEEEQQQQQQQQQDDDDDDDDVDMENVEQHEPIAVENDVVDQDAAEEKPSEVGETAPDVEAEAEAEAVAPDDKEEVEQNNADTDIKATDESLAADDKPQDNAAEAMTAENKDTAIDAAAEPAAAEPAAAAAATEPAAVTDPAAADPAAPAAAAAATAVSAAAVPASKPQAAGEKAQGTFEIPPGLDKLADRRAADAIAQGKFGFAMLQFADRSLFLHKYEVILGRKTAKNENDIHLGEQMNLSRKHARLRYNFQKASFELEILGKNGAFVQGVLLLPGQKPVLLASRDHIQMGDCSFYFLLPAQTVEKQRHRVVKRPRAPAPPPSAERIEQMLTNAAQLREKLEGMRIVPWNQVAMGEDDDASTDKEYVVRQKLTYSLGDPEDDKLVLATIRKIIMDEQAKGFSGLFEVKHVVKQIRERYPKVEEKVPFAMFPKNVTINNEQIDYWDEFTRLLRANADAGFVVVAKKSLPQWVTGVFVGLR